MSLIELLVTEYRHTLHAALFEVPLTTAFALLGARSARLGADRPGFADMAAARARARVKAHFTANYTIA